MPFTILKIFLNLLTAFLNFTDMLKASSDAAIDHLNKKLDENNSIQDFELKGNSERSIKSWQQQILDDNEALDKSRKQLDEAAKQLKARKEQHKQRKKLVRISSFSEKEHLPVDESLNFPPLDSTENKAVDDIDKVHSNTMRVTLTPEGYLSDSEKRARNLIIGSKSLVLLQISHDRSNSYDSKAIKVFNNGILIGFIRKLGSYGKVDTFCFSNGQLKNNISLKWSGVDFVLFKNSNINSSRNDNQVNIAFGMYGVSSFWHLTHKNNIIQILNNGILSNKEAYDNGNPTDISNQKVQKWREHKDPFYGKKLHEYAPLYLVVKNPMLYVKRNIQNDLCLIEVSLSALSKNNFLITDGNAASKNTKFYNSLDNLNTLPWDVLYAQYWSDFVDGKRKRCAEVLIYPSIDPDHIKHIHCYSNATLQYLKQLNCNATITKNLFF